LFAREPGVNDEGANSVALMPDINVMLKILDALEN